MRRHPDADALMNAIRANPDDDVPRLVYADWLQEHDDEPRAEFIRVQVVRSQLPEWDVRQIELRLRETALLQRYSHAWREELPRFEDITWGTDFERGFVVGATIGDFGALVDHHAELAAATPIRDITYNGTWDHTGAARVPTLPWLRGFRLSVGMPFAGHDPTADMRESWQWPFLQTITRFNLKSFWLDADDIEILGNTPLVEGLHELIFQDEQRDGSGLAALGSSPRLRNLTRLGLTGMHPLWDEGTTTTSSGLTHLASSEVLTSLTELDVNGLDIDRSELNVLLSSPRLGRFKVLRLAMNRLQGDELTIFDSINEEIRLDVLDLSGLSLSRDDLRNLARSPVLSELKILRLARCGMPDWIATFSEAGFGEHLCELDLNDSRPNFGNYSHTNLEWDKLPEVRFPNLHSLHLRHHRIPKKQRVHLAAWPSLAGLRLLDLSGCRLAADGVATLAKSPHCPRLISLDLSQNGISSKGSAPLTKSPLLSDLRWLSLGQNPLRAEGLEHLAEGLPRLWHLGLNSIAVDGFDAWRRLFARPELAELVQLELVSNALGSDGVALLAECEFLSNLAVLNLQSNPIEDTGLRTLIESPILSGLVQLYLVSSGLSEAGVEELAAGLKRDFLPNLREVRPTSTDIANTLERRTRGDRA